MKDEIIRKLQTLLGAPPIEDEPSVVYLLTQVRKVFERDGSLKPSLPTLRFYCSLALHTKLDQNPTAKDFLETVNPILTLEGNHDAQTQEKFDRLLTLQTFRDELREFLLLSDIESALCDNEAYWNTFLSAYSRVVENCEIAVEGAVAPPRGPLGPSVQSVSIGPAIGEGANLVANRPYPMDWVITYSNGQRGRLSLSDHGLLGAVVDVE